MARPSEPVNVHYPAGDVDETIATDRRQFVKRVGLAVLTVQILPLIAHAATTSPNDANNAANDLIIHSGSGAFGHVHDLLIPEAILKTPPREGVKLTSTKALLHRHEIALTQQELVTVNQGGTVEKKSSSHVFVIALAPRRP